MALVVYFDSVIYLYNTAILGALSIFIILRRRFGNRTQSPCTGNKIPNLFGSIELVVISRPRRSVISSTDIAHQNRFLTEDGFSETSQKQDVCPKLNTVTNFSI